jgi:hypothetical protein
VSPAFFKPNGIIHVYLIVSREGIHEAEEFVLECGIFKKVHPRQWKAIIGTRFVKVSKVDTHFPFSVRLFNQNNIRQPLRIVYFLDKSGLQQLLHLFSYGLVLFRGKALSSLFDRSVAQVDHQLWTITEGGILGISS